MIPASGAYRNITGAQHAIHGAKPGEYSPGRLILNKTMDNEIKWVKIKLREML